MTYGERVIAVLFAFLLLTGGLTLAQNQSIHTVLAQGKERTFASRAVSCRLSIYVGVQFAQGDVCLLAETTKYYDPQADMAVVAQRSDAAAKAVAVVPQDHVLLCRILGVLGRNDPACAG